MPITAECNVNVTSRFTTSILLRKRLYYSISENTKITKMLTDAARSTSTLVVDKLSSLLNIESINDTKLHDIFRDQYTTLTNHKLIRTSSGAYRTALIFNTCVVKTIQATLNCISTDYDCKHAFNTFRNEYRFIQKMRRTRFARHFPEVVMLNANIMGISVWYQLQEKINMVDASSMRNYEHAVIELADKLGIGDMHSANYGWKYNTKGVPYPVFIDCEDNNDCTLPVKVVKPVFSWMNV